ncbi:hypothetical protein K9N50_12505 [bacterium]|nr:hypothetical protein [bacterium]
MLIDVVAQGGKDADDCNDCNAHFAFLSIDSFTRMKVFLCKATAAIISHVLPFR